MSHFTAMLGELSSASRDLKPRLPRGQRLKRLAFCSSPLIAAAAIGTGTLYAKKMRAPPEANFVASRAAFRCAAVQRLAAQREVKEAGVDVESLCRAAQRMRGPVERDLAAAECLLAGSSGGEEVPSSSLDWAARALGLWQPGQTSGAEPVPRQQLWAKLVEVWRTAGYLSEPVQTRRPRPSTGSGLNPATGEDESYGRDVGCEVPLCMLSDGRGADRHRLSPTQWAPAANALQEHGMVLLKSFIPDSQLAELRHRLEMRTSVLDAKKSKNRETGPIREYDTELDRKSVV